MRYEFGLCAYSFQMPVTGCPYGKPLSIEVSLEDYPVAVDVEYEGGDFTVNDVMVQVEPGKYQSLCAGGGQAVLADLIKKQAIEDHSETIMERLQNEGFFERKRFDPVREYGTYDANAL